MNNKLLFVIVLSLVLILIALLIGYPILNSTVFVISEEKCVEKGDDCWHSLAHQTFNASYCYKIKDNETQEHCLEHISGNK